MTDRPRYADKGERDKKREALIDAYEISNVELSDTWALLDACDHLQAKLDESVAREAALLNKAAQSLGYPGWRPGMRERLLDDADISDAARELLAERDSLRADAEKHANRNIQLVEILDNVKRENAALKDTASQLCRKLETVHGGVYHASEVCPICRELRHALAILGLRGP